MDLYMVMRRNGWRTTEELEAAADRSTVAGEGRDDVRWIRSYVLDEEGGLGTACFYEAESPEVLREHAAAADLPVDEIVRVADTLIVSADPATTA